MLPSLPDLAAALRTDELALDAMLDKLAERFAVREPELMAFYPEADRFERLHGEAAALLARYPEPAERPALFGIPVAIKDIFHVDGFATTAGSSVPPAELAGDEAVSVAALRAAGALILGKSVTTEFAYFAPGATRNPVDSTRTPGGSSSGSAAAVGAGLCLLALGTQTIGSVCRPASYCGVVGFKPSYERVSCDGVIPLAPSLDHVGWFTRDVAGARIAAAVLCANWRPVTESAARPRLGVPESPYLGRGERRGRERFRRACEQLVGHGFEIRNVPVMPDFDVVETRHRRLVAAEAARVHAPWWARFGDRYHPKTRQLIETGLEVSAEELATARAARSELRAELTAALDAQAVDLYLAPAAPDVAPLGLDSTGDPVMNLPWTQAGLPSLSLPLPCAEGELPFGLQVIGRWQQDEQLLASASLLEKALAA